MNAFLKLMSVFKFSSHDQRKYFDIPQTVSIAKATVFQDVTSCRNLPPPSSGYRTEAGFSKMLVSMSHTKQHHIPEDYYLNTDHCENLKSHSIHWTIPKY